MMDYLIQLDEQLIVFLNSFHSAWADQFMMAITGRVIWLVMYIALAAALVYRYGWIRGLAIVILIGLSVGCADMLIAKGIRPYFERLRPSHFENEISQILNFVADERHPNGYRPQGYGFPSCHASNTIALAVAACMVMRKWFFVAFMFLWAGLLCYSRIYLGVHYPGDILIGGLIGCLIGLFFGWLATLVADAPKLPKRPKLSARADALSAWCPVAVGILTLAYAAVAAAI